MDVRNDLGDVKLGDEFTVISEPIWCTKDQAPPDLTVTLLMYLLSSWGWVESCPLICRSRKNSIQQTQMANMKHERLSNNQSLSEASSSSLRMASWMFLGMMRFFLVSCQNVCRFCSGNIESDLKYISLPSRSFQQVPRSPRKHTQWHRSNRYPWSKKIGSALAFPSGIEGKN